MSSSKKIKLTDHFRITSKPRDPFKNISNQNQLLKQQQLNGAQTNKLQPIEEQKQQQQQPREHLNQNLPPHQHPTTSQQPPKPLQTRNPNYQNQLLQLLTQARAPQKQITTSPQALKRLPQQQLPLNPTKLQPKQQQPVVTRHHDEKAHQQQNFTNKYIEPPGKGPTVADFDKNHLSSFFWEPHYAWDSFEYDREQEIKLSTHRRALSQLQHDNNNEFAISPQRWAELVDWLVTIQIRFALEHEPVFMAVKLADHYLAHKYLTQDQDVLLFIVTILISAKFDERVPPLIISDLTKLARVQFGVRFTRKQVISLEIDLLNTLNFHIRYPLSYGFLRRFAMCTRSDVRTMHLARYILESSLMDYNMIEILDSKIAAGSLLLAFKMLGQHQHQNVLALAWDETAEYYTGYDERELSPLVKKLNDLVIVLSKRRTSIRQKYRHESFKEVARIPPLSADLL